MTRRRSKQKAPAPRKAGRPPEIADVDMLKRLMRTRPSLEDVAIIMGCGERTVQDTIRREFDMTFIEFRQLHMAGIRQKLVDKALDMALEGEGNATMLIHCLRNICDWNAGATSGTVVQIKNEQNVISEDDKRLVQDFKDTVVSYLGERKEPA